jgi:hypothetical protein
MFHLRKHLTDFDQIWCWYNLIWVYICFLLILVWGEAESLGTFAVYSPFYQLGITGERNGAFWCHKNVQGRQKHAETTCTIITLSFRDPIKQIRDWSRSAGTSGLYCLQDVKQCSRWIGTNVKDEYTASVLRYQRNTFSGRLIPTLKLEQACSIKTLVPIYQKTRSSPH